MRILLTGGSGYLGSILARKLLANKHSVRILDNFLFGKESLADIKNKKLELVTGDIRDLSIVGKSLKNIDSVIHLASIVGTQSSELDPKASMEINFMATRNIAELCKIYKIKQFIFASTCSVYGAQPDQQLIAENSEVNPLDSYGLSKFQSERAILQAYDYPTILRLGTLFGASHRMRFDLAINLFIAQAINGEKITVFGGDQWRPFLHVDDAAEAFSFAVEKKMEGIYNVIWKNLTINQMAKDVKKLIPAQIDLSADIVDKRDYKVTGKKLEHFGYKAKKDIAFAAKEFKSKIVEDVKNYKQDKYSNYKSFFNSKAIQRKVYTQGPIFKR